MKKWPSYLEVSARHVTECTFDHGNCLCVASCHCVIDTAIFLLDTYT